MDESKKDPPGQCMSRRKTCLVLSSLMRDPPGHESVDDRDPPGHESDDERDPPGHEPVDERDPPGHEPVDERGPPGTYSRY